jgi:group I intron endonuclease
MDAGIYKLKNIKTGHVYIGQSVNLKYRIRSHKQMLRDGIHDNGYLQNHFKKYGADAFEHEILERCSVEFLDDREIYWILYYNSMNRSKGYNLESGGNPQKIVSESTREKKTGRNNPMYGKHWNDKQRINITLANRANSDKLTETDVVAIKQKLVDGVERKQISIDYTIDITTVSKIVKCKNWKWVSPDLNELLQKLWETQTEEKRNKAAEMRAAGIGYRQISAELHMCSKDVKKAFDKKYS